MFEVREKPEMVERALLVRFYFDAREATESESLLEELGELVKTLGIQVSKACCLAAGKCIRNSSAAPARPPKSSNSPAPMSAM
jgi:hypothetical protein